MILFGRKVEWQLGSGRQSLRLAGMTRALCAPRTRGPRKQPTTRTDDQHCFCYLLAAGTFAVSGGALGIVVTRAPALADCAALAACGVEGVIPNSLRTSASSFAMVSLLSFRN